MVTDFTEEQKGEILTSVCEAIQSTLMPITEICKQQKTNFRSVELWGADNKEWRNMLQAALTQRAWRYAENAISIIDNTPTYFEDTRGNRHESSVALNKAKYQADIRFKLAETLAPETFGNLRYLLRDIEKRIAELEKQTRNEKNFV